MFTSRRTRSVGAVEDDHVADVGAMAAVIEALASARDTAGAVTAALTAAREASGGAYGSYWVVDPAPEVLRFSAESGWVSEEFARVTVAATFARGVNPSGLAWAGQGPGVAIHDNDVCSALGEDHLLHEVDALHTALTEGTGLLVHL